MAAAWFVGIALFIGVLIFAFSGESEKLPGVPLAPCEMVDAGNGFYRLTPESRCKEAQNYASAFRSFETQNPGRKLEYIGNDMFIAR